MPDIAERMKAGQILDKILGSEAIPLPSNSKTKRQIKRRMQKKTGLAIVGSDVVSLFPSLKNVESARLARIAVLNSSIEMGSFDHLKALRYIYVSVALIC